MYLDGVYEVFRIRFELPPALGELVGAGCHHAARTDRCLGHISVGMINDPLYRHMRDTHSPASNGKKITGDWDRLVKPVQLIFRMGGHG